VCQLKGYIERTVADWSVRVLDLNLEAYVGVLSGATRDGLKPPPDLAALRRIANVYRGKHPEIFYDRLAYLRITQTWAQAFPDLVAPQQLLTFAYKTGRMPDFIWRQVELVKRQRPTMVGISVCYTEQLPGALCLARAIKEGTGRTVIMGGTFFSGGVPASWKEHRRWVDMIVVGGGEEPLAAILQGQDHPDIVRLAGEWEPSVLATARSKDMDPLGAPDFSDLPLREYYSPHPVIPLQMSSGCYWGKCTFCAHYMTSAKAYQQRSAGGVVEEIEQHVRNGIRHFAFVDSVVSPVRLKQFSDAVIERGLDIAWSVMAKPQNGFPSRVLERIAEAGCKYIHWGVESANQRILDLMDKGSVVADVEELLARSHHAGIRNHVFMMFGFPTETRAEMQDTLDFLERMRPYLAVVGRTTFVLEDQTPVWRHPEQFSVRNVRPRSTPHVYDYDCDVGMSRAEIREAFQAAKPFFRTFSGDPSVGGDFKFRDHSLLTYDHFDRLARASTGVVGAGVEEAASAK
jgi:radical SAM superfamily enzyme YgiQ (UPF0313 family)